MFYIYSFRFIFLLEYDAADNDDDINGCIVIRCKDGVPFVWFIEFDVGFCWRMPGDPNDGANVFFLEIFYFVLK